MIHRRKRRSKQLSVQDHIAANRDREVEQLFSDLEREIIAEQLRKRLATLAPDREKQESKKQ